MLPRGDDALGPLNNNKESAHQYLRPLPTPLDADPMFLPEQTPSPSSSQPSPYSLASSSANHPIHTPPPLPYALQQQLSPEAYPADVSDYYDMHHNEASDPFDDAEWAARRLRAHGKRRQRDDNVALDRRGGCFNIDNSELSCQPVAGQQVIQNQWFEFQWSPLNPLFNQVNDVDIYLFNGQTGQQVYYWEINKLQGSIQVAANDTFWGPAGPNIQPGQNQTFPYYFVIIPSTATVHNGETSEPTFYGIQTALPNSILQSQSEISRTSTASVHSISQQSTASAASVASMSTISSVSIQSKISTAASGIGGKSTQTPGGGGSTQNNSGGDHFPSWAIALIVILAFFLLLAALLAIYLVIRRARRRREEEEKRNSMGSASPMIDERKSQHSPTDATHQAAGGGSTVGHGDEKAALLGGGLLGAGALGATRGSMSRGDGGAAGAYDGASMMSGSDTTGPGMLSGADAAIVADAFRQAMRKPDFTGRPVEEDESPDQPDEENPRELMSQELAKEGRDIRSVASARDVKVQGSTPPS